MRSAPEKTPDDESQTDLPGAYRLFTNLVPLGKRDHECMFY